jgi:hypothetical protein
MPNAARWFLPVQKNGVVRFVEAPTLKAVMEATKREADQFRRVSRGDNSLSSLK